MHSTPTSPAARISYCLTLPVITSATVIYARVLRGPRSADLPERERRKDCTAGVGREAAQALFKIILRSVLWVVLPDFCENRLIPGTLGGRDASTVKSPGG